MLAEEEQFGKLSLLLPSLLAGLLGQGAADSSECLISLLGVLTNVGLVEGVAAKMATSPLVAALSELLSIAQTLPVSPVGLYQRARPRPRGCWPQVARMRQRRSPCEITIAPSCAVAPWASSAACVFRRRLLDWYHRPRR